MPTYCRVCGDQLPNGDLCSVCRLLEEGGVVAVWKGEASWTNSIFARPDDVSNRMPEPDTVIPAEDYAAFVLAERCGELS